MPRPPGPGARPRPALRSPAQNSRSGAADASSRTAEEPTRTAALCTLDGDQRQSLGVTRRRSDVKPYRRIGMPSGLVGYWALDERRSLLCALVGVRLNRARDRQSLSPRWPDRRQRYCPQAVRPGACGGVEHPRRVTARRGIWVNGMEHTADAVWQRRGGLRIPSSARQGVPAWASAITAPRRSGANVSVSAAACSHDARR